MALTLGDNFSYQGAKPLDARLKYETVAAMKAVADATMYDGCLAYCAGTDKTYQWKSGNTVDETTGKWREFTSGGGGGGGTSYTAGDGIDISGENVISTEKSETGWMDEVIEKVPMSGALVNIANAFNRSDLYSTTERVVGQWIDGKPLYQKTIVTPFSNISVGTRTYIPVLSSASLTEIDEIVDVKGFLKATGYGCYYISQYMTDTFSGVSDANSAYMNFTKGSQLSVVIKQNFVNATISGNTYATVQYTKTTDQAVSIGEANEYSTSEKIIGTWIDGKPLYQKTIETVSPNAVNLTKKLVELESNCQIQNFFGFMGENGDTGNVNSRKPINYGNPNTGFYMHTYSAFGNDIHMMVTRSYEVNAPVWITVQYTKISS